MESRKTPPAALVRSRISPDLIDAPTQRLYLVAFILLLQAIKLAEYAFPTPTDPANELNWSLCKWLALDLFTVQVGGFLAVERMDYGRGWWVVFAALGLSDWLLFGNYTFTASVLLPTFLEGMFVRTLTTTERSVRRSTVIGPKDAHLGGQFTVHILAVGTAQLNPTSVCYCLASQPSTEPILIPLLLNNTIPSNLTYTITSLSDPPTESSHTISFSSLSRPLSASESSPKPSLDFEDVDEWALKSSLVRSSAPHHTIPSPERDALEPSQQLYFLPISEIGIVRLTSVLDQDGIPVRLRVRASEMDGIKVLRCPRGGWKREREVHTCLNPSVPENLPLNLAVSGSEPLTVQWHVESGMGAGKKRKDESLGSIRRVEGGEEIVQVPLNVSLLSSGRTSYVLDSVTDSCGNRVDYTAMRDPLDPHHQQRSSMLLPGTTEHWDTVVHTPATVSFSGASGRGEDIRVLEGRKVQLEIRLDGVDFELEEEQRARRAGGKRDSLFTVGVEFSPTSGGEGWEKEVKTSERVVRMEVDQSGTYEIMSIKGKYCEGVVALPSLCTVVAQPPPTVLTTYEPILDSCGSAAGVDVSVTFSAGAPPYTIHYSQTQLSPIRRTSNHRYTTDYTRADIKLEPGPGVWEYKLLRIDDQYYKNLPVRSSHAVYQQTIPVQAGARFKDGLKEKTVHSCAGDIVSVDVELVGSAPYDIEYTVIGSTREKHVIHDIQSSPYHLDIPIPSNVAERGGQFSLSLESIIDNVGCRRALSVPDLTVDVRRTIPTAKFVGLSAARSAMIREQGRAVIPLRLTGEGPWTVTYQPPTTPKDPTPPVTFVSYQPNTEITIAHASAGIYSLVNVRDRFCPGEVSREEKDWTIETLPKPGMSLAEGVGKLVKNGSIMRTGVCEGKSDSIGVVFEGKAPFKASYTVAKGRGDPLPRTLSAIHPHADLKLFTNEPGHHVYVLQGVADSVYTTPEVGGLVSPAGGKEGILRVEQDVFPSPTASFRHGVKSSFCLNDPLASRSDQDLIVRLEGTAPFSLDIEVREDLHGTVQRFNIPNILTRDWPLSLPYIFSSASSHHLTILHLTDAHCASSVPSSPSSHLSLPVAQIPTLTPVLPQSDHCVGDLLQFDILGSPPLSLTYTFNSTSHTILLSSPRFSRLASSPGLFKIVSIQHEGDDCPLTDIGLERRVWAIPEARVSEGRTVVAEMREGDQMEIVFSFVGEPPFAFTYERRAAQDRSKDRTILETQTVSGIMEHKYSILTSQAGTWTVSSVRDAHCSYTRE